MLVVDEIGVALRFATAVVTKSARRSTSDDGEEVAV
jgi:hypothetical protein